MRRLLAFLILIQLATVALPGQSRSNRSSGGKKANTADSRDPLLASFRGKLKLVSDKKVLLFVEQENTLEFRCTRKTVYWSGDKKVQLAEIGDGAQVLIEAKRAPDATFDAVNIRLDVPLK